MEFGQRYPIAFVAAAVLAIGCSESDNRRDGAAAAREATIPDTVRQELVRLGTDDQAVREGLTPERMQDTAFVKRMLRGDSTRSRRLRTIVDAYGWPDSIRVGPEAANAAFLILQHSPMHAFQKAMMPTIEKLARQGAVPRQDAALLIDRVLVHEGRPQRYGTQLHGEDGHLVVDSVADPAGLEERRKAMGLTSMDEYLRAIEEMHHMDVARQP